MTTRVEARLGSPDGYQTFDTGTNQNVGYGDEVFSEAHSAEVRAQRRGRLRFVFLEDGTCEASVEQLG